MTTDIRLLIVEDDEVDAELLVRQLRSADLDVRYRRVDNETDLTQALRDPWDAVVCDVGLPGWDGLEALRVVRRAAADLPFVFVSGSISDEQAVAAMRLGADDYVFKDNLHRLSPALRRELAAYRERARRRQAEAARELSEQRYGQVLAIAADAIITVDVDQRIRSFNRAAEQIFGYRAAELLDRDLGVLVPARFRRRHKRHVAAFLAAADGPGSLDHTNVVALRRDGTEFPAGGSLTRIGQGADALATVILRDHSAAQRSEEQIRFLAHFDPLTQLPNRSLFVDRLRLAVADAARGERSVAVAVLDLDRFRNVNDTRGHTAGDEVLAAVAARLSGSMRFGDMLCRLGGDEFGMVLDLGPGDATTGTVLDGLLFALRLPIDVGQSTYHLSGSLGLALYPGDGADTEHLLANAELAMYRAKRAGGDRYEFYRPEMTVRERDRVAMENDLLHGLRNGQLSVQFQPQIELATRQAVGCEALARWIHPARGAVPADTFIAAAEAAGMIGAVGAEVMRQVARCVVAWHAELRHPVMVAVNASLAELARPGYADRVLATLAETGLPPSCLQVELTERDIADEPLPVFAAMRQLEEAGVTFAIDDFGTGYSNLSRLRQLPFRVLKVDKSLIRDLPDDADSRAIVAAVITMAQQLGLQTLAEGVERADQGRVLADLGCDLIQGYWLASPMWPDECLSFLREHHCAS